MQRVNRTTKLIVFFGVFFAGAFFVAFACRPPTPPHKQAPQIKTRPCTPQVKACDDKTKAESAEIDRKPTRECPEDKISKFTAGTMVRTTPINGSPESSAPGKGPGFSFYMRYSSKDDRSSAGRVWPVGFKWSHDYEMHLWKTNNVYHVVTMNDVGAVFAWNGSSFVEGTGDIGHYGEYELSSQSDKIVARRKSFGLMTPGSVREGALLADNGAVGLTPSEAAPPYVSWHASDGYVFEPDGSGTNYRLARVVGRDGEELALNYNGANAITSVVDAVSNAFVFSYSASGYLTNIHDVTGNRDAYFSYTNNLLAQIVDMGGQTNKYGYDSEARLTSLKRPSLTGFDETTFTYWGSYSAEFKVTVTHPEGNQGYLHWDAQGNMRDNLDGLGETIGTFETYSWGPTRTEVTDPLGRVTSYIFYDNTNAVLLGRLKKVVNPDGTGRELKYDLKGNITEEAFLDSSNAVVHRTGWTYAYFDGTEFLNTVTVEETDAATNVLAKRSLTYARDDRGNTNSADDVYMLSSERTWISTNEYSETRYLYDTNTFLLSDVQVLTEGTNTYRTTRTYTYDSNRRVIAVADALTNKVYFGYDSIGRLASMTMTNAGQEVKWTYDRDSLDRVTNRGYPDGASESCTHAPCGAGVLTATDRGGNVTVNYYDANKRIEKITTTSPNGTLLAYVEYQYNSAGQITNTVDKLGNSRKTVYNAAGELVKIIDPLGRTNEYLYDTLGRQYKTISPDASYSVNTYDSFSRVTNVAYYSSANVRMTRADYTYDPLGRALTTKDALGNATSNTYDRAGRLTRTDLPNASYTRTQYDLLDNPILTMGPVTNAADESLFFTTNAYDNLGRLVFTVDAEGRTNSYVYDQGWVQQVGQFKNPNGQIVREMRYDVLTGRLLTNVMHGVRTVFSYDLAGNTVKVTYPDGSYSTNAYDGWRLQWTVNRRGLTNAVSYDEIGRVASATNSLGNVTTFGYDAVGNITNVTDALTNSTYYAYDAVDRLVVTTFADGRATTNAYDDLARFLSSAGAGPVGASYRYDALGRMTNLVDGVSNVTAFAWDPLGSLTGKTQADGHLYSYTNNPLDWLQDRVDPKGALTRYTYNRIGQLTNVNYQGDTDVRYFYDTLGRMTQRVDAAGTWAWTYNGESWRVESEVTPYSQTITYTYDTNTYELTRVSLSTNVYTEYLWHQGRLTNVNWNVGGVLGTATYSYKPNSHLLETTTYLGGTVTVHRTYDSLDRLTQICSSNSAGRINSFSYSLDSTGRRIKRTDNDGSWIDWAYDSHDRLTNASRTNSANGAADAAYHYVFQYDMAGNRLHEDRGQLGLDGTFNCLNQLTHLTWGGKLDLYGTIMTTNAWFTNKVNGVVSTIYTNAGSTNFLGAASVGPGSNVISVVTFDASGTNETLVTVRMPPTNPQVFLWDANGNLTNDGSRVCMWDEENRLVSIESSGSGVTPADRKRSEFVYDAAGRRTQRTDYSGWTNNAYSVTNVTRFVWDRWNLLAELDSSNAITAYHVWGQDVSQSLQGAGGIGGLLARCTVNASTNSMLFYTFDGNGNVTDVLHPNGAVAAHYEYDPFGRIVAQCGPHAAENTWRFSSKQFEVSWGLYYFGLRYFDPERRIWLSADPIQELGGHNLHEFCFGDPINLVDALGLGLVPGTGYAETILADRLRAWGAKRGIVLGPLSYFYASLLDIDANFDAVWKSEQIARAFQKEGINGAIGETLGETLRIDKTAQRIRIYHDVHGRWLITSIVQATVGDPVLGSIGIMQIMEGGFGFEKTGEEICSRALRVAKVSEGTFRAITFSLAVKSSLQKPIVTAESAIREGPGAMTRLKYEPASYHGKVDTALKSKAPTQGQEALDFSLQVKETSPRRIGIDPKTDEFVVFDQTTEGVFHGHVRPWNELPVEAQNALRRAGMVDAKGRLP